MAPEISPAVAWSPRGRSYARGARVEHLDDQFRIIGRSGHLISLISAPAGHRDAPVRRGRFRGRQVLRLAPLHGSRQIFGALRRQLLLPGRKPAVQAEQKMDELRPILLSGSNPGGRIFSKDVRRCDQCAHAFSLPITHDSNAMLKPISA